MWKKMWPKIILLIFIKLEVTSGARRPDIRAFYTKLECFNYDLVMVPHLTCALIPALDSTLMMNVEIKLAQELNNGVILYNFSIERNGKYDTYLSTEIDICEAMGQVHKNMLLGMIISEMRRVTNLPLKCPLKKNFLYAAYNYTIDSDLLPSYTPALNWASYAEFRMNGKRGISVNTFGTVARSAPKKKKN